MILNSDIQGRLKPYLQNAKEAPLQWMLFWTWLLSMILVPITLWVWNESVMRSLLAINVVIQAILVLTILATAWTLRRVAGTALVVIAATLTVEIIGSQTGVPFGRYHYTNLLQPQIGHVPVIIPLAWLMMLPPAWAVASHFQLSRMRFAVVSALAMTAWDLLLDPQMVTWQLWVWDQPGLYFGIPLSNYAGWLLTSFVLSYVLWPGKRPLPPLLIVIYTITWALEMMGLALFWGQPGPAFIGGLGMGFFVWLGWRTYLARSPQAALSES